MKVSTSLLILAFAFASLALINNVRADDNTNGDLINLRNVRYCEVMAVTKFSLLSVTAAVYNNVGLNDCPISSWDVLINQTDYLKTEFDTKFIHFNGPRFWMMDAMTNSTLIDNTTVLVGEGAGQIAMRHAGDLEIKPADLLKGSVPYKVQTVARNTVWVYNAGTNIYTITDNTGLVYVLQSYSIQTHPEQTIDTLVKLGSLLSLPSGWSFSYQTITSDVNVVAINGVASVIQDDYLNTYQLSTLTKPASLA